MEPNVGKKLYRVREGELLMGVCNGIAKYFDLDVVLVRIAFVAFGAVTHGAFVLAYFVMAILMPVEGGPAVASEWREKWRYHAQAVEKAHDEHVAEQVRVSHEYHYRGPTLIGELLQLLIFSLGIWALYTYVPQTQPFFNTVWRDVQDAWAWLSAKLSQ